MTDNQQRTSYIRTPTGGFWQIIEPDCTLEQCREAVDNLTGEERAAATLRYIQTRYGTPDD